MQKSLTRASWVGFADSIKCLRECVRIFCVNVHKHFPKEIVYSFLQFLKSLYDINGYDIHI